MKGQIEKIRQYIEAEIQESVETEQNKYLRILKKANPHDLEWMNEYGKEVTESEKETAVFYFSYPKEKICRMAEHITDAFFHGFISQNRERGERKRVRLFYRIGQEALAVQVAHCIEESTITAPQSSKTTDPDIKPIQSPDAAPESHSSEMSSPQSSPDLSGVPANIASMMRSADVAETEVREVIAQKGYYPMDTPWSVMDADGFIAGWLLPFWDKVVEIIKANPNRLPF